MSRGLAGSLGAAAVVGLLALVLSLSGAASCGKGTTGPQTPTPTPNVETFVVTGVLFLDDDGNGERNPEAESVILPDATVEIGGRTGTTDANGAFVIAVPRGTHPVILKKLPPFFTAGAAKTITSPQPAGDTPQIPTLLPGQNNLSTYLSSGDSISEGYGSTSGFGYRRLLGQRLRSSFGRAVMEYRGGGGGQTDAGAFRIDRDMRLVRPQFVLIDWGTNDWNNPNCGDPASAACPAVANLRSIVQTVKLWDSHPCLLTITPPNVGFSSHATQARADWVDKLNEQIKLLAQQESALLIDVGGAFKRSSNLSALFFDHLHPNDAGYEIMAATIEDALLHGTVGATTSRGRPAFGFSR
jgi:lysophospholipase L1-like esterase